MHNRPSDRIRRILARGSVVLAVGGTLGLAAAATAQTAPVISQPVVQQLPGGESMKLNTALGRLAADPRNVEALMDAGNASLTVGDVDAAVGFFQRASQISPANAKVTAGLAAAYVSAGDPAAALPLFDEAERLGTLDPSALSARGLAFDLVGDNATAQTFYREAMAADPSDETVRRYALSLAMSGDRKAMETLLSPLLQKYDMAAWRTRAFGFAILGVPDEAESIVRQVMPPETATAMGAYLRYMPRLTHAQQAAAANLGQFPRAAEIGREDPRLAALARSRPIKAGTQLVSAAQVPAGVDKRSRSQRRKDEQRQAREAEAATRLASAKQTAPTPAVVRAPVALAAAQPRHTELPPVRAAAVQPAVLPPPAKASSEPARTEPARTPPADIRPAAAAVTVAAAPVQQPPVAAAPPPAWQVASATPAPAPANASTPGFASLDGRQTAGFDLRQTTPAAAVATPPATPPPPAPAPVKATPPAPAPAAQPARRNIEELFADLTPPSREVEVASGAVDVRKLPAPKKVDPAAEKAAREKAAAEAKAKEEKALAAKQPSRIWVQLATGRDKKALAFDFRRFTREDPDVFKGRKGFTSAFGASTRMITGPFANEGAANSFLSQLKKAGHTGAYVWTSPAGQVVDPLPAG